MYILFFLLWVTFNGRITLEIVLFGLVISAAVYAFICKFMDFSIKKDIHIFRQSFRILQYIFVLIREIIKANVTTISMIISSKYEIEPVIVHFKTRLKTKTARVVLANSITLTPGTITVSLEEDELVVHCLDKDLAKDLEDSIFVQMLERMERMEG